MKQKMTFLKKAFLSVFCIGTMLCFIGTLNAQTTQQSFTSSTTWTIPTGVLEVTIECWGAGGGGGHIGNHFTWGAAGGGGGAYAQQTFTVTAGQTIEITVGTGGSGGSGTNNGGDSYAKYNGTTQVLAKGGNGVADDETDNPGTGGQASACIGTVAYSGGNGGKGSTGTWCGTGGGGAAAGAGGNGGNGGDGATGSLFNNYPGTAGVIASGSTHSGNGAEGVVSHIGGTTGNNGNNYGGGGSGGATALGILTANGGNGANGLVVITYNDDPEPKVDNATMTICSDGSFNITPTGLIPVGTKYSWDAPTVSGISGTTSGSNATTVSGTLTSTNNTNTDVVYTVTATSPTAKTSTFTVTVTVIGILDPGTIGNNIISCNAGDTIKSFVSVTDAAGPGEYFWLDSTASSTSWSVIPNATNATFTPTYKGHTGITYYRRGFKSDCEEVYSNILSMTYPGIVDPGSIKNTAKTEYCMGDPVDITLTVHDADVESGASFATQWQSKTDGTEWTNISGATSSSYNVVISSITENISYRYTIKLDNCDSVPSNDQVDLKALPAITTSTVTFDDKNDTITLYYGICDTLYVINPPAYSTTITEYDGKLILSNNISTSNSGPILGRISGGEYTIIWTLTDPCGTSLNFPKKYIVMYPPCGGDIKATDADGIEYESVRIGCECWTKTNLRTVTGVTGNSYVYQDDPANETKFGRLYSWYSAVGLAEDATTDPATVTDPKTNKPYVQGICPAGWALPTASAYVNMVTTAGGVNNIKSSDASTWLPDIAGTDATGFGAVGAGYYTDQEFYYYNLLGEAYFWTCEGEPTYKKGTCCSITLTCPTLLINTEKAGRGMSIRCVKRNE